MEPSAALLKKLATKPNLLKLVERYKKEFDIYQYLSDHVPKKLEDKDWEKVIEERVALWSFTALTQKREEADLAKKEAARKKLIDYYLEQERLYNSGGMGYAPGFYRMFFDPFAQLKQNVEKIYDMKHCLSGRLKDQPTLALDLQYIEGETYIHRSRLSNNLRSLISDNRILPDHLFPLTLINADANIPVVKSFIENLGFFNRENRISPFLPELHVGNPLLNLDVNKKRDVVYISRFARDMLDGPLTHSTYIIPVTFDDKRESISGARTGNFRVMTLPFKRYVKWQSGPMFLPLTGIQKVLNVVSQTGGDWHRALHENVSQRHLVSHEENRANTSPHKDMKKFRRDENKQVVAAIKEVFGET